MPKWFCVEEIQGFPLSPNDAIYNNASIVLTDLLGVPMHGFAFRYQSYAAEFLVQDAGREKWGEAILEKLEDRRFTDDVFSKGLAASEGLVAAARAINDSQSPSGSTLAKGFEKYCVLGGKSMGFGYLGNLLDYSSDVVDNVLLDELERRVRLKVPDKKAAADTLVALTSLDEETFPTKEHLEFLKLAELVGKDKKAVAAMLAHPAEELPALFEKDFPRLAEAVLEHQKSWEWLSFLYVGPAKWDLPYFYRLLNEAVKNPGAAAKEIADLQKRQAAVAYNRKAAAKLVEDDALFYAARRLAHLKAMRKDLQVQSFYYLNSFYKSVARKFGVSPTQARFHTSDELVAVLEGKAEPNVAEANARFKEGFWWCADGKTGVLSGAKAAEAASKVRRPLYEASDVLKGTCACPGFVTGTVKVVNSLEEAGKLLQGEILVSYATNPELVSAMRRSAAIVTDAGGLTCHAAIVSRELNIPCVIGTKIATKVFKDGDSAEVDATNGIVCKL